MSTPGSFRHESFTAARHVLVLGSSLALTTTFALIVRTIIPRFLGPGAFGELRLAETLAEVLFVVLTFGVDMNLRREAAVGASNVQQYIGGLSLLRVLLGAIAIAVAMVVLRAGGASRGFLFLAALAGSVQIMVVLNNSYAALEQSCGDVGWLARTNTAIKIVWAVTIIGALKLTATALGIVVAGLSIEAGRFVWLTIRAVKRHNILLRADVKVAFAAIVASIPIFVNSLAHNLYARIGTAWLGAVRGNAEVGFYSAAANVASLALLGMPLLISVLVPSAARAAVQTPDSLRQMIRGFLRVVLLVAVPGSLLLHMSAAPLLSILFGDQYAVAASVLKVLVPTFGLAYVSTICAIVLQQQKRSWTVAVISFAGVVCTVALDATLIPWGIRHLGAIGGAQGAAWATLITEVFVTTVLALATRSVWAGSDVIRTFFALGGGVAALGLASLAPSIGRAPSVVLLCTAFAGTVILSGGLRRGDLSFLGQLLRNIRQRSSPADCLSER